MQSRDTLHTNFFHEMFEALPVPVALTDHNGIVVYSNKELSCVCGVKDFELKNLFIGSLFEKHTEILNALQAIRNNKLSEYQVDCKLHGCDAPVQVILKNISGYMCFTLQVNQALYDKISDLAQRNRELVRSNQDLSQYAYVASHDLQEPLRKIRIFSDMLTSSPQLSGKERFIANKINMASERMTLLIRDLLNYSKLLKADAVFETVNLQEILSAVMVDFEVQIQEKKAVIRSAELPAIRAVKLQMNQLFYNLMGNALKFTLPGHPPEIEITACEMNSSEVRPFIKHPEPDSTYLHIQFTDHGIGFDSKDSEKIFEVFKRLYPREVYEGSGIGLALCRRIVQNHKGHLFAKSSPGEGTTFNIIVPSSQPGLRA